MKTKKFFSIIKIQARKFDVLKNDNKNVDKKKSSPHDFFDIPNTYLNL